jgi:hypothetical protein
MIRKDTIIAVLATFCLTLTLFSTIHAGGYDPWADINDDGIINMKDIANVASQFNTAGDSTKNVSISSLGHYESRTSATPLETNTSASFSYSLEGYRQVSIAIVCYAPLNLLKVEVTMGRFEPYYNYVTFYKVLNDSDYSMDGFHYFETFAVQGPEIRVLVDNPSHFSPLFYLDIYMTC